MLFGSAAKHAKQHYSGSDDLDRAYFRDYIHFPCLDGFVTTIDGAGTIEACGNLLLMTTGNVTNNDVVISHNYNYHIKPKTSVEHCIYLSQSITNVDAYLITCHQKLTAPPVVADNDYWGFKISNGSIFAINCDDGSETSTDTGIDRAAATNYITTMKTFIDYSNIKFYVNGILKATHTTNIPSMGVAYPHLILRTKDDVAKIYRFGRIAISINMTNFG